jgi:hypothetical protein
MCTLLVPIAFDKILWGKQCNWFRHCNTIKTCVTFLALNAAWHRGPTNGAITALALAVLVVSTLCTIVASERRALGGQSTDRTELCAGRWRACVCGSGTKCTGSTGIGGRGRHSDTSKYQGSTIFLKCCTVACCPTGSCCIKRCSERGGVAFARMVCQGVVEVVAGRALLHVESK